MFHKTCMRFLSVVLFVVITCSVLIHCGSSKHILWGCFSGTRTILPVPMKWSWRIRVKSTTTHTETTKECIILGMYYILNMCFGRNHWNEWWLTPYYTLVYYLYKCLFNYFSFGCCYNSFQLNTISHNTAVTMGEHQTLNPRKTPHIYSHISCLPVQTVECLWWIFFIRCIVLLRHLLQTG